MPHETSCSGEGFVPRKGFWSQYAGQGTVSCATSAICIYALSETAELTQRQKSEFERVLLAFGATAPAAHGRCLSEDPGEEPSAWTTGQAALAFLSLGARWEVIRAVS